ncbi:hypothetical protein F4781DRAFT_440706 [Annulohypoxylon bovei var. microspora]|nr:hypothetical protein F4781DRAFT_440706 [Annulohypoxylon bovei var. microspora]
MGVLTKTLVTCLIALCYGIANCAVVQVANKQELLSGSLTQAESAPVTIVNTISETIVPGSSRTVSAVTKIRQNSPQQPRAVQDTVLVTATSSNSSSPHPTRTGEDTSGPARSSTVTSHVHSPIMTTIPEEDLTPLHLEWPGDVDPEDLIPLYQNLGDNGEADLIPRGSYDGYGGGYGSGTTGPVNGGYGNPSGPTNLPSGGYGNPLPPTTINPIVVTVLDPPTVTVSLGLQISTFGPSSPTAGTTVVVVEPAPSTHSQVQNVTVIVAPPQPTVPLPLPTNGPSIMTIIVPAETTHSSPGYVYTTVTPSYAAPHIGTSTLVVVHTPTANPGPIPISTSAASRTAQPSVNIWLAIIFVVATVAGTAAKKQPGQTELPKSELPKPAKVNCLTKIINKYKKARDNGNEGHDIEPNSARSGRYEH